MTVNEPRTPVLEVLSTSQPDVDSTIVETSMDVGRKRRSGKVAALAIASMLLLSLMAFGTSSPASARSCGNYIYKSQTSGGWHSDGTRYLGTMISNNVIYTEYRQNQSNMYTKDRYRRCVQDLNNVYSLVYRKYRNSERSRVCQTKSTGGTKCGSWSYSWGSYGSYQYIGRGDWYGRL